MKNYLDRILEWAVIISFILMILTVILQIVARYGLPWSPHWTEELARFCFIYMVSLGAGLAVQERAYVSVTTLLNLFPKKARYYMDNFILSSVILLMLFMVVYNIPLIEIVSLQSSASLKLNMGIMYFAMTFMGLFVIIYCFLELRNNFKRIRQSV
jgi:TRAP-type C4-dicarboxylate transport system permease small subunit